MSKTLPMIYAIVSKAKAAAIFLICCCSFATVQAQGPVSGTFTINSNLPTSGNNFQTFTEAVFSLLDGVNGPVIFNVAAGSGPYIEQININEVPGASAVNSITFNGNGTTLEYTSTNSISRAVLKLDGAKYTTINNLVIHPVTTNATDSYGWGVALLRDADFNTIRNCTINIETFNTFSGQNYIGIFVGGTDDFPNTNGISNCDNNIIDNNTITGGYEGINMNNFAGNFDISFTSMDNNQVTNNKISNFINTGIYLIWNKGTLVQGNDIQNINIQSCAGIQVDEKNYNLKINGNRIHNISTAATAVDFNFRSINVANCPAATGMINTISNNLIYDIRSTGDQEGIGVTGSSYVNVYHNTILLDDAATGSGRTTSGFYYESNIKVNFKNNIVGMLRQGTGYGINMANAGADFSSDYNDIFVSGTNVIGRRSGNHATLAAWQTATGFDVHSTSQDPLFTSLATGNLKPTSAAIDNLGLFAGIAFDINGDIKNNTPDIGAYEFLTPPCNTPVIAGASVGIPAIPVCGGGLRTLNLEGNSFGTGQTYQWQSSATLNGTYTNVSSPLVVPLFDINPTSDLYYRALVTCSGSSTTSEPIQITIRNPLSGTYTINSNANTSATNFKSFEDVVSALNCGIAGPVVLNVAAGSGPYNEQVIINAIAGSSATNTITINGNGATLTYLSANINERATLKINGADYVTVDNLVITAQGTTSSQYGIGVHILNDADHNVISNCTINTTFATTSSNYAGIWINASDNDGIGGADSKCDFNKISGNTVIGGYYGILLSSDPTVGKMINDTVINNVIRDQHIYGLYVRGTDHALIEGNNISRPNRTITGTYIAIYLNGESSSLLVSKNKIHATHAALTSGTDATTGISSNNCDATAGNENVISNNLIYNFGGLGAQIAINNSGSDYALYLHNSISLERQVGAPTSTVRAFYQTTAASGLQYRNNIVSIKRNGTGTNHAMYMNTAGTTFTASNNNYRVAGTGTNRTGFRNGTQYTTVEDWKTGSGSETNSVAFDPIFSDQAAGNLYPNNLDLDNLGTTTAISTDITNITRSATTPDIGAYEFAGTLPVKLLNISARFSGSDVLVNWTTVTEQNAKHFVIQRSTDALNFTDAGIVNAAGNSNTQLHYQFTDVKTALPAASVIYYRLAMVDLDGTFDYSNTVAVQISNEKFAVTVQPNPFVAKLTASIVTQKAGMATVQLSDISGRIILKQLQLLNAGTNVFDIDKAAQLQSGVYFINIEVNGSRYVQKLVK